jgi:hypothetical protein
MASDQRPRASVPVLVWCAFLLALGAQMTASRLGPHGMPDASDLAAPPTVRSIVIASLGDALAAAKVMNLQLQAHDNQPGRSLPFARLDYPMVIRWLERILELDPQGPYPMLAASRLYGEVPDGARSRLMLEFVHRRFLQDPDLHWAALAHAAYVARHRLRDLEMARRFAHSLRVRATGPQVPAWARQMEMLLLADINEADGARAMLGALLESGQLTDLAEYRFLRARLAGIQPPAPAPTAPGK